MKITKRINRKIRFMSVLKKMKLQNESRIESAVTKENFLEEKTLGIKISSLFRRP